MLSIWTSLNICRLVKSQLHQFFHNSNYQASSVYQPHKQKVLEEICLLNKKSFSRNYLQDEILEMYTIITEYVSFKQGRLI